jgi:hypothetical protein
MRTRVIRYLGVAIGDSNPHQSTATVLVPIGFAARLSDRPIIGLSTLSSSQLAAAARLPNRPITRADEDATLEAYGIVPSEASENDRYSGPPFGEQGLFRTPPTLH